MLTPPCMRIILKEITLITSLKTKGNNTDRWFLYILKCCDNTFYTGITNDLQRRLDKHNDGSASRYTRSRRPVKLIYHERCQNKSSALKKECRDKVYSPEWGRNAISVRKPKYMIPCSVLQERWR